MFVVLHQILDEGVRAPRLAPNDKGPGGLAYITRRRAAVACKLAHSYPPTSPTPCPLLQRILAVHYTIPPKVCISEGCADLLQRIFVADPAQRISLALMQRHPWFVVNLPRECQVRLGRCRGWVGAHRQAESRACWWGGRPPDPGLSVARVPGGGGGGGGARAVGQAQAGQCTSGAMHERSHHVVRRRGSPPASMRRPRPACRPFSRNPTGIAEREQRTVRRAAAANRSGDSCHCAGGAAACRVAAAAAGGRACGARRQNAALNSCATLCCQALPRLPMLLAERAKPD